MEHTPGCQAKVVLSPKAHDVSSTLESGGSFFLEGQRLLSPQIPHQLASHTSLTASVWARRSCPSRLLDPWLPAHLQGYQHSLFTWLRANAELGGPKRQVLILTVAPTALCEATVQAILNGMPRGRSGDPRCTCHLHGPHLSVMTLPGASCTLRAQAKAPQENKWPGDAKAEKEAGGRCA